MILRHFLSVLALASPKPSEVPKELEGRWLGTVTHGADRAECGFEFVRNDEGRVLANLWLAEINLFGSPMGEVTRLDGRLVLRGSGPHFELDGDQLRGDLGVPELSFELARVERLPSEPKPPDVPTGPEFAWTYSTTAAFWASPRALDGVVYVGDSKGVVHAVATADGSRRWTFDAGSPVFGDALVTNAEVMFVTGAGQLVELDRRTGELVRRIDIGGGDVPRELPAPEANGWDTTSPTPVLDGGTLYVPSADGVLHAIDAKSGESKWQRKLGGNMRASACIANGRVYVGSTDDNVYAVDAKTGEALWQFDTGSKVTTAPMVAGELVVIGTRDRSRLFALDAASGQQKWESWWWMSWIESAPCLVDGKLYVGSSDSGRVRALEPADGRAIWTAKVFGWTWGTPLVVGDKLYCATSAASTYMIHHEPSLCALERASGKMLWRKPLPRQPDTWISGVAGSLARDGDKLIAALLDGRLIALPMR